MPRFCLFAAALLSLFSLRLGAEEASVLPANLPAHPRLVATADDWAALPARCREDQALDQYSKHVVSYATRLLALPPLERKMTGRRLLHVSREFVGRALTLSYAYRISGDKTYLAKAREAILAVCAFPDWNPSHFLDVAEMATGLALAYDWLYADLSPADRLVIREALKTKALNLVRGGHSTFALKNNWAQVCGGGMTVAALALADEEPALCEEVLRAVRAKVDCGLHPYAPDGVYPEGPSYWGYGTCYQVLQLACLRSALGRDWDIPKAPGFLRSVQFLAAATAPSGAFFNYADCGANHEIFPALFYLAREAGQPELVSGQEPLLRGIQSGKQKPDDRFAALLPFWWPFNTRSGEQPPLFFTGQGDNAVAMWRSAWNDPAAFYFAIKAGGAGVSHGHMDAGSFVLERDGVRWCEDLGMQDYESIESRGMKLWDRKQNSDRWTIFRLNNHAHNTLSIGGQLHDASGLSKLLSADEKGAEIDLLPALLPGSARQARRRVFVQDGKVRLIDTLSGLKPGAELVWQWVTRTTVEPQSSSLLLHSGDKKLRLAYHGSPVRVELVDAASLLSPWDAPNPGVKILRLCGKADEAGNWELIVDLGDDSSR